MEVIRSDEGDPAEDVSAELIGADEIAFTLPLTEAELKLTYTALRSLLDDLGHDEHELIDIVRAVLDKLPDEHSIRAINIR
jgi:hypothetical protein